MMLISLMETQSLEETRSCRREKTSTRSSSSFRFLSFFFWPILPPPPTQLYNTYIYSIWHDFLTYVCIVKLLYQAKYLSPYIVIFVVVVRISKIQSLSNVQVYNTFLTIVTVPCSTSSELIQQNEKTNYGMGEYICKLYL